MTEEDEEKDDWDKVEDNMSCQKIILLLLSYTLV